MEPVRGRAAHGRRSGPMVRTMRAMALAMVTVLALAGTGLGVNGGITNAGFEDGLTGWESLVMRGTDDPTTSDCSTPLAAQDGVCIVEGSDTFTVEELGETRQVTVTPNSGTRMARLGGPFLNSDQSQSQNRYILRRTFAVPAGDPIVALSYNVFTFDYTGFDELNIRVRVLDETGEVVAQRQEGSFGTSGNTSLKTTGWRGFVADLTGFEGQQMRLVIDSGGTNDTLFGFWAYIDDGEAPVPPPAPLVVAPELPGGGQVGIQSFTGDGGTEFVIPVGQVGLFPGGCMPLTMTFPVPAAEGAVVGNVSLILAPADGSATLTFPATGLGGNSFTATIDCVQSGDLLLEYTITEGPDSQTFVIPFGGLVLIDPQGVIHDAAQFAAFVAAGDSPEVARSKAAIAGATVRLQRQGGDGVFRNVLASDPGIAPNVNPQITGSNGLFQWDVSAGVYRVLVSAPGYVSVTSEGYDIPPPKLDAHIALTRVDAGPPPPPPPVDPGPGPTPAPVDPGPAPDTQAPVISALKVLPKAFRPAGTTKATRAKDGGRLTWTLSEAGATTITVERLLPGRRKGGACVAPPKSGRATGAKCTRALAHATLRIAGAAGPNTLRLTGRKGAKAYPVGKYRARMVTRDAAGNASAPAMVAFSVLAPQKPAAKPKPKPKPKPRVGPTNPGVPAIGIGSELR